MTTPAMRQHNFRQLQAVCDGHRGVQAGAAWSMVVIFTFNCRCLVVSLVVSILHGSIYEQRHCPVITINAAVGLHNMYKIQCLPGALSPSVQCVSECVIPIQCYRADQSGSCSCLDPMPKAGFGSRLSRYDKSKPVYPLACRPGNASQTVPSRWYQCMPGDVSEGRDWVSK